MDIIKDIKARHENVENSRGFLQVSMSNVHKDRADLITMVEELQAQVDRMRPYAQHKKDCDMEVMHYALKPKCTCGFETAIKGESDG